MIFLGSSIFSFESNVDAESIAVHPLGNRDSRIIQVLFVIQNEGNLQKGGVHDYVSS